MEIWKRVRSALPDWPWTARENAATTDSQVHTAGGEQHLALAKESLRDLLDDPRVPEEVRAALAEDYSSVRTMLDKIEHGHIHIAVFGRVSVGKSSLLNALLGGEYFRVSPLHGETKNTEMRTWEEHEAGGVWLIDTPGINEIDGEARERMAREVVERVDLVLFVADGDLTELEQTAVREIAACGRPLLLVLNKADRYTSAERETLVAAVAQRCAGLIAAEDILLAAASPAAQTIVRVDANGVEHEESRQRDPDVVLLRQRLWEVLDNEGKTLAALNASLFAGKLSEQVAERIVAARRSLAEQVVRTYCIGKGVAVALNPVPVVDLAAAAVIDGTMVWHLSQVYGLPLSRAEAGSLVRVIVTQMTLLMGTVWAMHFVSSLLKAGTGGLSTLVTAGAQGAVAYYGTYVVGKVAERYLAAGKSWGEAGPKYVVQEILDDLDRDSILKQARADIRARLRSGTAED